MVSHCRGEASGGGDSFHFLNFLLQVGRAKSKCREAADTYAHASGAEFEEVVANAKQYMEQGWRHVRVQVGLPGMAGYGSQHKENGRPQALHDKPLFEPAYQMRRGDKRILLIGLGIFTAASFVLSKKGG